MSLATVRTRVNDFLMARWPAIVARQDAYYETHGRYWQGLWTHNVTPDQTNDDADAVPDQLDRTPSDQPVSWRVRFNNAMDAIPFPARLKIDVYESSIGHGWFATFQIKYNGTVYQRTRGVGPLADEFTENWKAVE